MVVLSLLIPVLLLLFLLLMERVERPLRNDAVGEQLVHVLEVARPEEVEVFVRDGFAPTVERYWRQRRRSERRPQAGPRALGRRGTDRLARFTRAHLPYRLTGASRV